MSARLSLALLLALPAAASAAPVELPLGLSWCDDEADVRITLSGPVTELSEGVIEASAEAFGTRGTLTAVFDQDALVNVRYRTFDNEGNYNAIKGTLEQRHGEGTYEEKSKAGSRRMKGSFSTDGGEALELSINSEQIYVAWQVPNTRCNASSGPHDGALTDAEKADIAATTDKPAIAFDPYAEDPADLEERMEEKRDKEKKKDRKEEEARKKEDPKDVEIDW